MQPMDRRLSKNRTSEEKSHEHSESHRLPRAEGRAAKECIDQAEQIGEYVDAMRSAMIANLTGGHRLTGTPFFGHEGKR